MWGTYAWRSMMSEPANTTLWIQRIDDMRMKNQYKNSRTYTNMQRRNSIYLILACNNNPNGFTHNNIVMEN